MPFLHKLARRLAISGTLAGLGLGLACSNVGSPIDNVSRIVVQPHQAALQPGQHQKFVAYGQTLAGDLAALDVTWRATGGQISPDGMFRADTTPGDYMVTATASQMASLADTSYVQVDQLQLDSLVISPANPTIRMGSSLDLAAIGYTSAGDTTTIAVTWTASDGTVSGGGKGKGHYRPTDPGKHQVGASGGDQTDTTTVTVVPDSVATVSVTPASTALFVGEAQQLAATLEDSAGTPMTGVAVTWKSSDGGVATVDTSGRVTARGAGSATITATSEGKSGTAAISASLAPVASVTVTPASAAIRVGQTGQLAAAVKDSAGNTLSGRTVTWTSSNAAVATVNGTGLVTAVGAGSATITAASEGKSGRAAVAISLVPVASVTLTPSSATLLVGQTAQLTATAKDSAGNPLTGRTVTWNTSNAAAATVNGAGLVTAVAPGSATITATSEGTSGTAQATVSAPTADPSAVTDLRATGATDSSVTLSFTEVNGGAGLPASYDVRYTAGAISWGSATSVTRGTCTTPVVGIAIGATRTCTVLGLSPSTSYQFQLVAFRGTLNVDAVFGAVSDVASQATTASTIQPPPPSDGEPQPPATSLLIQNFTPGSLAGGTSYLYESYDRYTDNGSDVTLLNAGNNHYGPLTARTAYYNTDYFSLVTGRGGSGLAMRSHYTSAGNEPLLQSPSTLGSYSGTIVFSYYIRFPDASGFVNGAGMKFFEMWYAGTTLHGHTGRIQLGAYGDSRGFSFNPGWAPFDESRSGAEIGYQPVGPYPTDLNDGNWHRVTVLYRPNTTNAAGWNGSSFTSASSRDGRAAAWIDGTKIVDVSSATAGVTPQGGTRSWCSLADVDTLGGLNYAYIGHDQYPEYLNGLTAPFNVDVDDLKVWTRP